MTLVEKLRQDQQEVISRAQSRLGCIEELAKQLTAIEEAFAADQLCVSHSWGTLFTLTITCAVKNIAQEMAPRLELMEALGIPLEAWETEDDVEARKRVYMADQDKLRVCINACLTDDATCRVEVVGYREEERGEYVYINRQVPITHIICAD